MRLVIKERSYTLFGVLTWRLIKGWKNNLAVYLMAYAVWRFAAEYLRADDRGATVVSFLSPSQFVAVLLFALGTGLLILSQRRKKALGGNDEEA